MRLVDAGEGVGGGEDMVGQSASAFLADNHCISRYVVRTQ